MVCFSLAASTFLAATAASLLTVHAAPTPADGTSNIAKRDVIPVTKGTSGQPISAATVFDHDIARVKAYNNVTNSDAKKSGTINNLDVTYVARIKICSKTYSLIVDTGSSNLWAGARNPVPPTCGTTKNHAFSVTYGSGSVSGTEYTGPVSFAGLTVKHQSFGSAFSSNGFNGVDGIVGFGPVDLTEHTVEKQTTVPTFLHNLASQYNFPEVLGVYFHPLHGSDTDEANGELTLGGVDHSKFNGPISYVPLTTVLPYSNYWGINVHSIKYSGSTLGTGLAAIVDTGTTLILFPLTPYEAFLSATGGTPDLGLTRFASRPTGKVVFTLGGSRFTLTPTQYLVPRGQYSYYGLAPGFFYSWISTTGGDSDLAFIIGQKFLENYYSVYDKPGHRVGFAPRR